MSKQHTNALKRYEGLTRRGQVRRLRELAKAALGEFGMGIDRLVFIKHLVNTTFRLWSGDKQFLVRVHREKDYTVDLVESELAWLKALSQDARIVVQTPYLTPRGKGVVMAEARGVPQAYPVTVLSWLDGQVVPQKYRKLDHYEALGRMIAVLHDQSMHWRLPKGFTRPLYDAEHQLGKHAPRPLPVLGPRHLPAHILKDMETMYERRLEAEDILGTDPAHFGLIHFDLSFSNILFSGDQAIPIDFDACGFGFYVYDLAVALTGLFVQPNFTDRCEAVFRGYRHVRPIPEEWLALLPTFMASRTASYILHVVANEQAVLSQWRSLLRPLLEATPDQFPN